MLRTAGERHTEPLKQTRNCCLGAALVRKSFEEIENDIRPAAAQIRNEVRHLPAHAERLDAATSFLQIAQYDAHRLEDLMFGLCIGMVKAEDWFVVNDQDLVG